MRDRFVLNVRRRRRSSRVALSPLELYKAMRAAGWTEGEARNLQAYSLGLAIADENRPMRPWTKRQLDVVTFLKRLYAETGGLR